MESSLTSGNNFGLTFLGTGTSTGVPVLRCHCPTCTSSDPRDRRLRTSALITTPAGKNILIDCGPDFRQQILREDSPDLEALLITHSHYDHVGGIDDLRPYCDRGPFPVYCRKDVADDLKDRNPWSFAKNLYPGVPTFDIHTLLEGIPVKIADVQVLPIAVKHGKLDILGFRIGPIGYITDCSYLSDESISLLRGVDTLVINALRFQPHPTHFSLEQALGAIHKINPRQAFLTHVAHHTPPTAGIPLPKNVKYAFDGLKVKI